MLKIYLVITSIILVLIIGVLPFVLNLITDNSYYLLLYFITIPFGSLTLFLLLRKVRFKDLLDDYDKYDSV